MSVINLVEEENITIIQGINGISLFEESWMKQSNREAVDFFIDLHD